MAESKEEERAELNPEEEDKTDKKKSTGSRHMSIWRISLELPIFIDALSIRAAYGAGQNTQLLLWKVCNVVLAHNATVCRDINKHHGVEEAVQRRANTFSISDDLLNTWPPLVAAVIAGSLSDRYGGNRRWLVCLPILGAIVSAIFQALHYTFIWQLPLEFFYLDNFVSFFGGLEMYFMGLMAYGADISRPEDTAHRLARYDAVARVGRFLGTLVSPYLFKKAGYYGCYLTRFVLELLAFILFLKSIKTFKEEIAPRTRQPANETTKSKLRAFLKEILIKPVRDMWHMTKRVREKHRRFLLHAGLLIYFLCVTGYQRNILDYLYLDKVFHDFSAMKFAQIGAAEQAVGILSLIVLMPVLTSYFHESLVLLLITLTIAIALTCAVFVATLIPGFLAAAAVAAVDNCNWSLVCALLSKTVKQDEVGKVFALTSLMNTLNKLCMNPIFRMLYNATLTTFPGSFLILSASSYYLICLICVILFVMRRNFRNREDEREDPEPKISTINS